jgi:hypothetical protein
MQQYPVQELPAPVHKVYVSLTTSPKRLSKIHNVLSTLDLTHVEAVFLSLPEKYKNKEPYGSTAELEQQFPKLKVIRRPLDLGPIMKLLPAVQEVQALGDPNAIVITVDDDTAYPRGMVGRLVKTATKYNAVAAGWGTTPNEFGLTDDWPESAAYKPHLNIVEGFAGVAYPVKFIDVPKMIEASKLGAGNVCKTSDDITISWALAESHVPRIFVRNRFFPGVAQFKYGFEADALSAGSGCTGQFCDMRGRYQACAKALRAHRNTLSPK